MLMLKWGMQHLHMRIDAQLPAVACSHTGGDYAHTLIGSVSPRMARYSAVCIRPGLEQWPGKIESQALAVRHPMAIKILVTQKAVEQRTSPQRICSLPTTVAVIGSQLFANWCHALAARKAVQPHSH